MVGPVLRETRLLLTAVESNVVQRDRLASPLDRNNRRHRVKTPFTSASLRVVYKAEYATSAGPISSRKIHRKGAKGAKTTRRGEGEGIG